MKILSHVPLGPRVAAGLAAATALAAACEPVKSWQPTEAIILCGSTCVSGKDPSNTVSKAAGGVGTYAWGTEELLPPAGDPYGTQHRLTWTSSSPTQLLIAFDTDFSAPIPDPSCPLCSQPYVWSFVTLPGTGGPTSKLYSFAKPGDGWSGFTTGHLIRVDRGACRSSVNWSVIFDQVESRLDAAVGCAMKCEANAGGGSHQINRLTLDVQPHFTGVKDDVQHGLLLTASYETKNAIGSTELVSINPVYIFGIDPETGRLQVTVRQLGVVTFDDGLKASVSAALSQQFARDLLEFADPQAFTAVPLSDMVTCDEKAPQAAQQATCFAQATTPLPGTMESKALITLRKALLLRGHVEPEATELAKTAASTLEPHNFACEVRAKTLSPECVIRSTYKRLYGLPTLGFEAVLADAGDEALIALYTALGHGGTSVATCGPPVAQVAKDGYVPRDMGSAPVMNVASSCPPCP